MSQDNQGVDPARLRKILKDRKLAGKKMPKIMYLNVTGVNPIGCVMPLERRKEIYKIACKYDFLILDDDPYHFMYFSDVRNFVNCLRKENNTIFSVSGQ